MEQVLDIGAFLEPDKFRLGLGGFYPTHIKRTPLINFITAFIYFITFCQVASVVNYALSTEDLTKVSEIFLFSMTQVAFINKVLKYHFNFHKLAALDQQVAQDMFTRVNSVELKIWKDAFNSGQMVVKIYLTTCFGVILSYGLVPLLKILTIGGKHYPFPSKFPFNPDNYYGFIFIGEVMAVGVSAWINGSLDGLFTKHTIIATTQCTILCEKITQLLENTNDDHKVHDRIRHCIIYYNEIITYITNIEDIFSFGIFIQFLCSGVVICLTGFQLMVSDEKGQFGLLLLYLICMTFQLMLYCWYGHCLMQESNDITRACYIIKWEDINVNNRRMLMMMMERAKKPLAIKALGIFGLNLATYMTASIQGCPLVRQRFWSLKEAKNGQLSGTKERRCLRIW
ncbi:putative odorant receptor 71a [Euwallacea fornicatus]|uniref:putative odorant receptor 71a n=1 Tax=Euwallacea fornicatus TaxID=995702 RepID=UPI00338EDD89